MQLYFNGCKSHFCCILMGVNPFFVVFTPFLYKKELFLIKGNASLQTLYI